MTQDAQTAERDSDRLDSWKEIAGYLGKSVRTALRWSKEEGMPVYRHVGSQRGAVYAYRSEIDAWIHANRSGSRPLPSKPALMGAAAALFVIALAAVLFLWPARLTEPFRSPAAEPPWVLITDFQNHSGEARFDGTVETAMRRELANSRRVMVIAPERISDTLALMERAPDSRIDTGLGREICLRYGGVCVVLAGRVEKYDAIYLFSIELVDPVDGRAVASAEEQAAGEAEVLPAVRRLGDWLRGHLGEELAQLRSDGESLERVTTPSLRALELYSRGMQFMYRGRIADAEPLFREAVEEDPEFASAHLYLFWSLFNQGNDTDEARHFLEQALRHSASASEREHYFIEGTYHDFIGRDQREACKSYKTLAELFPDHFFAAVNTAHVCGWRLGRRKDLVRYSVQAADQRQGWVVPAGAALTRLEGDFDRARPYVMRARELISEGKLSGWPHDWGILFAEFFAAEEHLKAGSLGKVFIELERIGAARESMDHPLSSRVARGLVDFHLALGQFDRAETLGADHYYPGLLGSWLAFLANEQQDFARHRQVLTDALHSRMPEASEREIALLGWNMGHGDFQGLFPMDVLVPLHVPESVPNMAESEHQPFPLFLSLPKFEAKLRLLEGRQLLAQGRPQEATEPLWEGVSWFRDHGDDSLFQYHFLGAELLAVALLEGGKLQSAYRVLADAAGQKVMVNSSTAPLHQKIRARLASLCRELERVTEAEAIEAEPRRELLLADEDHPILVQIREQEPLQLEALQ